MEHVILILHREIQVILAILACYVTVPKLAAVPCNVFPLQSYTVVLERRCHRIVSFKREDMIVLHIVFSAKIIIRNSGLPVVRRVNIEFSVENMN